MIASKINCAYDFSIINALYKLEILIITIKLIKFMLIYTCFTFRDDGYKTVLISLLSIVLSILSVINFAYLFTML